MRKTFHTGSKNEGKDSKNERISLEIGLTSLRIYIKLS